MDSCKMTGDIIGNGDGAGMSLIGYFDQKMYLR